MVPEPAPMLALGRFECRAPTVAPLFRNGTPLYVATLCADAGLLDRNEGDTCANGALSEVGAARCAAFDEAGGVKSLGHCKRDPARCHAENFSRALTHSNRIDA